MTNNGVFTTGPAKATAERDRRARQRFIQGAVKFINGWKKVS